jgi:hypothetical protein
MKKLFLMRWMEVLPARFVLLSYFMLGIVGGVFFHYLLYRIFLPTEPFIYVAF